MSQLNDAYYGPPIPPPPKSYRRPSRGGGCCCCGGILRCCCGCIFDLIFSIICKLILTVLVIVAIVAVIFWLIVRPNVVKVHVTDATLTQFNFTNSTNTLLHYNLVLNISIRNPNKRVGIYYDQIEASALYHDAVFANTTLEPFFQHKKNTTALDAVFKGQEVVVLGSDKASKVDEEKGSGVFGIDLKVDMKIRFKLGLFKTGKIKPKVRCQLQVPLRSSSHNGTSSTVPAFHDTACDWGYRWLWFH